MNSLSPLISTLIWLLFFISIVWLVCLIFKKKLYKGKHKLTILSIRLLLLFIIYIISRVFFFDIYKVSGSSMHPTLVDGDYVYVSKISYGTRLPRSLYEIPWINTLIYFYPFNLLVHQPSQQYTRLYSKKTVAKGDIVVFNLPVYQKYFGIKRCLKIPGDTIKYNDSDISILPYKKFSLNIFRDSLSIVEKRIVTHYRLPNVDSALCFPNNYYFFVGDNAKASTDSRTWGAVQGDHIVGKAKFIIFSKEKDGKFRWKRFFQKVN